MQDDQAHALPDAPLHALDNLVLDVAMRGMAPPQEHVGRCQPLLGKAMLGLLQRRRGCLDGLVFGQCRCNRFVHAVRIDGANFLARLFVNVLTPDHGPNCHKLFSQSALEATLARPALHEKVRRRCQGEFSNARRAVLNSARNEAITRAISRLVAAGGRFSSVGRARHS